PLSFYLKQKKHWPAFIMASLLEFFAFNLACACLVTSKQIKKDVLKKIIVKKNKVKKIANYINTEIFRPLIRIKKYDSRFICVSRLSREKNLSSLIKALKGTNFKLDLIGRGEEKNKLKRVARKAKIKVNFLGPYPNHRLASILNKYPIFILPSFYEGMPKSLLEAMSCGLACVATKTRGNIEIIEHKKTGLLCETSAQSLQKKITFLYKNKKLQKKLGRNARNFVKKNFSLYSQIKKEIKIYEKLA
ncbi:glycosyltransferase family 4 protein, partial [Patescibacteria group bacterium]|nr:glycosyltransferase family 4 protein [Patescibacteria group bacterium]